MRVAVFALLVALVALPAAAQERTERLQHQDTTGATPDAGTQVPALSDPVDITFEHITEFKSDIAVAANGTLSIDETIAVIARGDRITHGIYRDFPTHYTDKSGNRVHVRFDVTSVQMDGHNETYTTESITDGVRVKIGDKDIDVPFGKHVYKLSYVTSRQIGFFAKYDELYWNVTGNEWSFQIDMAETTITLPGTAKIIQRATYTGALGSFDQNANSEMLAPNVIRFTTTRILQPEEGLTIAVGFSKGAVAPPSAAQLQREFIEDNASAVVALLGVFALAVFYLLTWWEHGRDPKRGTIIPLYQPPAKLSPEAIRYIRRMAYDRKAFAATLINMAVEGYLTISQDTSTYTLKRTGRSEVDCGLSPGEIGIASSLFRGDMNGSLELQQANHAAVQRAISALQFALSAECNKHYFIANVGWFAGGIAILLLTGLGAALLSENIGNAIGVIFWLLVWAVVAAYFIHQIWSNWQLVIFGPGSRLFNLGHALLSTLLIIPLAVAICVGMTQVSEAISFAAAFALVTGGVLVYVFHSLLKAPTVLGAKTLDQIDGFKMYLETAETGRLEMLNPPEVTATVFEKYLPYAIALDCENSWGRKFEAQAAAAGLTKDRGFGYSPIWYSGNSFSSLGTAGFVTSIGSSIAGAAAAASSPSSGSGGGGFSGGGGGGGGGGGW